MGQNSDLKENGRLSEQSLDPNLWHVCAGQLVQMPQVNSTVCYFAQGHAEYAKTKVDFGESKIPPYILCMVSYVKYLVDGKTDEVYAKIKLQPLQQWSLEDNEVLRINEIDSPEKPKYYVKKLTESDSNNGGGFSVPKNCADNIFPHLDFSVDTPAQNLHVKDMFGQTWTFRHIYRGHPKRHLLTSGWSTFVNDKNLIAGDSVVFIKTTNAELFVGIRRTKRGFGGGLKFSLSTNATDENSDSAFQGYFDFLTDEQKKLMQQGLNGDLQGRVSAESVLEAAKLAAGGHPFEVIYYPRKNIPEFIVKSSAVRDAIRTEWLPGMKFKMAFETEDSSRISWFLGTVSAVQAIDPLHWPGSPWRLLQADWDERKPQDVNRVNPWSVEVVPNLAAVYLNSLPLPTKMMKLPQLRDLQSMEVPQLRDLPLFSQAPVTPIPTNPYRPISPLCCTPGNFSVGIQGARHAQFILPSIGSRFNNVESGPHPFYFRNANVVTPKVGSGSSAGNPDVENGPCSLSRDNSNKILKKTEPKKSHFQLLGHVIPFEERNSGSCSEDTRKCPSEDNAEKKNTCSDFCSSESNSKGPMVSPPSQGFSQYKEHKKSNRNVETAYCNVYNDTATRVIQVIDLSAFGSYEELCIKLATTFDVEISLVFDKLIYQDKSGTTNRAKGIPFSEFLKTAVNLRLMRDGE